MTPPLDTAVPLLFLVAVAAYLLGSVPFGILVSRLFGLPDPRTIGSKNIGATNVLRSGSKPAAALTLILDSGKGGIAAVVAGFLFGRDAAQVAGFCAFLGHLYPIYLRFQGGKGVATWLGTLLGLSPLIGVAGCLLWLGTFAATRISSASALTASVLIPVVAALTGHASMLLLLIAMGALVWWRHRANIARLRDGTEPRVGRT